MKNTHKLIYLLAFFLVVFTYFLPIPFLFIYFPILIYTLIKTFKQIRIEIKKEKFDKLKEKCLFVGSIGNCWYNKEKGFNKCSLNICKFK